MVDPPIGGNKELEEKDIVLLKKDNYKKIREYEEYKENKK